MKKTKKKPLTSLTRRQKIQTKKNYIKHINENIYIFLLRKIIKLGKELPIKSWESKLRIGKTKKKKEKWKRLKKKRKTKQAY